MTSLVQDYTHSHVILVLLLICWDVLLSLCMVIGNVCLYLKCSLYRCEAVSAGVNAVGGCAHHVDHHFPAFPSTVGRGGWLSVLHYSSWHTIKRHCLQVISCGGLLDFFFFFKSLKQCDEHVSCYFDLLWKNETWPNVSESEHCDKKWVTNTSCTCSPHLHRWS